MRGGRDERGLLTGDFDPGGGSWPVTILSHIPPVAYVCTRCRLPTTMHVVGKQPTGAGVKLLFFKKPLLTLGKGGYLLICNTCMAVSRQLSKEEVAKLEVRVVPAQICDELDNFFNAARSVDSSIPHPYTTGFAEFIVRDGDPAYFVAWLTAYRRERAPQS